MLWMDNNETTQDNQIIITQTYHQIAFFTYDIVDIVPFDRTMTTAYFLPECSERGEYGGECVEREREDCKYCDNPYKHEELIIDGFYVKDDDYVVILQTGVRVPISNVFYHTVMPLWSFYEHKAYKQEF